MRKKCEWIFQLAQNTGEGHLLELTGCVNPFWLIFSDNKAEEYLIDHRVLAIHSKKHTFPLRSPSVNINKEKEKKSNLAGGSILPLTQFKTQSRKVSNCKGYLSSSDESDNQENWNRGAACSPRPTPCSPSKCLSTCIESLSRQRMYSWWVQSCKGISLTCW